MVLSLGYTRTYMFALVTMFLMTIWGSDKPAYTEPMHMDHSIDDNLILNSKILQLTKEFDSAQAVIVAKTTTIDSQHIVLKKKTGELINLLNNDNYTKSHTIFPIWDRPDSPYFEPKGVYNFVAKYNYSARLWY